jgi:hypothetical protein
MDAVEASPDPTVEYFMTLPHNKAPTDSSFQSDGIPDAWDERERWLRAKLDGLPPTLVKQLIQIQHRAFEEEVAASHCMRQRALALHKVIKSQTPEQTMYFFDELARDFT